MPYNIKKIINDNSSHKDVFQSDSKGFTLIELTIGILLLALIMAIAIPSLTVLTTAKMKTQSAQLAGTIKFVYDLAARKSLAHRIVINIDEGKYWVEVSEDKVRIKKEKVESDNGRGLTEEEQAELNGEDEEEEESEVWQGQGGIEVPQFIKPKPRKPTFQQFKSKLTEPVELPDNISFHSVYTINQKDEYKEGTAYIHFFPTGFAEKAVIQLADDNDSIYTLELRPLTGKVKVYPYFKEIEIKD